MNPTIYLDTEFTDLFRPELLSLGMVTFDAQEHYVELDLAHPASAQILKCVSDFVQDNDVLSQWGKVPGATCTRTQMGLRTVRWLLDQTTRFGQPARIAFDFAADYELFELLLRDSGQWDLVKDLIHPLDVGEYVSRFDGVLGAAVGYQFAGRRGLERHHALADAYALLAACFSMNTGKRMKL